MIIVKEKCFDAWKVINIHLAGKGYKEPMLEFCRFVLHIVIVILFMIFGALVFTSLEEHESLNPQPQILLSNASKELKTNPFEEKNDLKELSSFDEASIWNRLEKKHQTTIKTNLRRVIKRDICSASETSQIIKKHTEKGEEVKSQEEVKKSAHQDEHFLLLKWFYFVTTCTTTIGYGHVHPRTDEGKLFYIFFSIIGIALMMTLLKKCGSIITVMNLKIISVVRNHLFHQKKYISDELMSVLFIIFMFIGFMLTVTWHDHSIKEASQWSNIDRFYFWIVTFTTVGFGDVHFSLTAEVEHVHELLMYRICGLSFLAAIIDSIQSYTKYRNKRISLKLKEHSVHLLLRLRGISERSEDKKSSDSAFCRKSSRKLGPRNVDDITDWQIEAMKKMSGRLSGI